MDTQLPSEQPLLSWRAPSKPLHERTRAWYIAAGTIVLGFTIYSLVTKAWTFTLVIMLGTALYWHLHREEPSMNEITLWNQGFLFGKEFVPWDFCTGFWIWKSSTYTELHIESKKQSQPEIVIQTGPVSPANIRAVVGAHIPEHPDRSEHILDTISKICKI